MSEDHRIILTPKQLKRLPGRGSKLSVLRLRSMIEGLRVEAGIDSRAWVQKGNRTMLAFEVLDRSDAGDVKVFHFKFEIPQIYVQQKKGPKYMESTSWRFFHDYLERRLYAVIMGISGAVEEFTDHMIMMLPDGSEQTVREHIVETLATGGLTALPFIRKEAPSS